MDERRKILLYKNLDIPTMKTKLFWGGEGAESADELDWDSTTDGEI